MGTFFYFDGQLIESVDQILSESEAFLTVARLTYDLGCALRDITWSIGSDFACIWD